MRTSRAFTSLTNGVAFVSKAIRSTAVAAVITKGSKALPVSLPHHSHSVLRRNITAAAAVCCNASSTDDLVELQLKVTGMVCDGCSGRVLEALQKTPGVKDVKVDLDSGLATVQIEAASQVEAFNAMPKLIEIVTGLGFEAQPHFE